MLSAALCLSLFCASSIARSTVFEALHDVPDGWSRVGVPPADKIMHFRIAMTQPHDGLLEQTLYDISTPNHPRYGQHMKRNEIKDMLRPHAQATDSVLQWLDSSGSIPGSDITDDGDFIHFVAPISKAETLLNTTFAVYHNKNGRTDKVRTLSYSLPQELHRYVSMIQPTTRFGQIRAQRDGLHEFKHLEHGPYGLNTTNCNSSITPSCLRSLYGVDTRTDAQSNGFIGINGFLEEYPRYADLAAFRQEYAPWMRNNSLTWTSVNGGVLDQDSDSDSSEANLDVQYALSIGHPVPGIYYSTPGRGQLKTDLDQPNSNNNQNEPYLEFFEHMLSLPDEELPHTLTTSYGEDEQSVPTSYAKTVCAMIGQLGLRGVSVIFSSGDTGVGFGCETNDGKNTTRFLPIFPAACPFVTSVGGTLGVEPERAIGLSSGGFSDIWERPIYQDRAVREYLERLGDRWSGLYNREGRGFPDVAAQSYRFHVLDKGRESLIQGTSASAPTFAGIVGLLNSARLAAGRRPLGFLNPWIYTVGLDGLTDIVDGGSTGCTGIDQYSGLKTPIVPHASWNATPGWDPVTGHGTPVYPKLLRIAMRSGFGAK